MRALQKLQNSIQILIIVYPIQTNKLSILGNIWRATILPFSNLPLNTMFRTVFNTYEKRDCSLNCTPLENLGPDTRCNIERHIARNSWIASCIHPKICCAQYCAQYCSSRISSYFCNIARNKFLRVSTICSIFVPDIFIHFFYQLLYYSYPNTAISSFNASFLLAISEHQRKTPKAFILLSDAILDCVI